MQDIGDTLERNLYVEGIRSEWSVAPMLANVMYNVHTLGLYTDSHSVQGLSFIFVGDEAFYFKQILVYRIE